MRKLRREFVIIANPGRQHSDQLAAALIEEGYSVLYIHGYRSRISLKGKLHPFERVWYIFPVVMKMTNRFLAGRYREMVFRSLFSLFDIMVARIVKRHNPDVVIGYENSAVRSFKQAKVSGSIAILDAADVHFKMQNEPIDSSRKRVNDQKNAELELADYVLNCSSLARDSYVRNGVSPDRAIALPLGVDLAEFYPRAQTYSDGPMKILFVGRLTRKKGADVFLEALKSLRKMGARFEVKIAADLDNVENMIDEGLAVFGSMLGKVAQKDLPQLYDWGDIIVVPSRFDSFGLVVYEALACGLPAIVSENVGSKDIIQGGVNGYIVPVEDVSALALCLYEISENLTCLRSMRPAARASVLGASWDNYRNQAAKAISQVLASSAR